MAQLSRGESAPRTAAARREEFGRS